MWRASSRSVEGVWKVFWWCLEGVWKVSLRCLESIWDVSLWSMMHLFILALQSSIGSFYLFNHIMLSRHQDVLSDQLSTVDQTLILWIKVTHALWFLIFSILNSCRSEALKTNFKAWKDLNPKNIRYTKIWVQPKVQQNIVDPKNYLEPEKMHATLTEIGVCEPLATIVMTRWTG